VSEQHDALVGKLFTHVYMDDVRVVDDEMPAGLVGKKYRLGLRSPVPTVIMGADDDPALVRRTCKAIIAIDMFAHSMEQLDDAGDVSVRAPYPQTDFVIALSGQ
jgi:hypothetical protein